MNKFKIILCLNALLIGSALLAMDLNNQGRKLRTAASTGSLGRVEELLDAGTPVDAQDDSGTTPLVCAVAWGRTEICKLLIARNAQVDVQTKGGGTPLKIAAWDGNKELCQLLVDEIIRRINDKSAAIALLGMKRFRNVTCMNPIDYNVIRSIARQVPEQRKQKLFEEIDPIKNEWMKEFVLNYARQQLNINKKTI